MKSSREFLRTPRRRTSGTRRRCSRDAARPRSRTMAARHMRALRQRGQGLVTALDLRLRRRARRHRAVRPPARVQPDLRGVRPAGALDRGRVRRRSSRSAAARSAWPPCSTPGVRAAAGLPADAEGQREACSPRGTAARPRSTRSMVADGRAPGRPGIAPVDRRGARRRLDGSRWPRPRPRRRCGRCWSTRSGAEQAARVRRSSPATSSRARSRRRTSTRSRSSGSGSTRPTRSWSRTPATACWPRPGRACAASSPSTATPTDEDFDEAALVVSSLGDPDGEPTDVLADRGRAQPRRLVDPRRPRGLPRRLSHASAARPGEGGRGARGASSRSSSWSRTIAQTAVDNEKYFGDLDSVVGDGDFGYSLARGFENVLAGGTTSTARDAGDLPQEDRR